MENSQQNLSSQVHHFQIEDKAVYLIGTAHVSKESVEDVRRTIEQIEPDTVCVELCAARHKTLMERDNWKNMDIFKIVKEKKAVFLLAQLILSSFYRRLGEQLDVKPGAEMIEAVTIAQQKGIHLVLADRDIEITLRRVWGYLNFWNKLKMASQLMMSLFISEKIDEHMIEELKKQDQLEHILETFAKEFPEVKHRLIDERDIYLAQKLRQAPGKKIVMVVGAGHVPGITAHCVKDEPLEPLVQIPPKSIIPALIGWSIPAAIVALIIVGFFKGGVQFSLTSIYIWILVTGSLSALGAALALAHPLAILASFLAAPLTTLHPLIAAGWVSGLVQVFIKKPTVQDMENLPSAIMTMKGWWLNPVTRVLLVVVLANVGSSFGALIAGGWIAGRLF